MNAPVSRRQRDRNRGLLVLIVALFLGSALVAGALRFSGWRPEGMRNHGELLQPPGDLRELTPRLRDGGDYSWNPGARQWRIALAPPAGCAEPCVALSAQLDTVWQLFGRQADRVHILWIGELPEGATRDAALREVLPDPALRAALPRVDDPAGVPVYVIDPNGFVILRYAPGFDPAHLRQDMSRLLKLR
ncbi:hypothetical protein QFW77_16475 [Luteimonas sp. RD2P54]|uniref:Thioredoxin domain-containing protein n=1 Tax=Luteimonas endophytica TaxID=3042023 RepID=A0ABT6JCM7_9GAMM|nr:hypothetical protein [Luteimonas endophytica]MDH5824568.1 hypothetical protein [Luteimonas endophytica]